MSTDACRVCGESLLVRGSSVLCPRCDWGQIVDGECVGETQRGFRCRRAAFSGIAQFAGGVALCSHHVELLLAELREERRREAEYVAESTREARAAKTVYYLRQADYIKIGFASDVAARVRAISKPPGGCVRPADLPVGPVELLATHDGGRRAEQVLHDRFRHLRVAGEWFRADPELLDHVARINRRRAAA